MATARPRRGYDSEVHVAHWFRDRGWEQAEAVPHGQGGCDILGMPAFSPEVKARKDFNPTAWLRDAEKRPGLPFVVVRCNGFGPANMAEWLWMSRLGHATELMAAYDFGHHGMSA